MDRWFGWNIYIIAMDFHSIASLLKIPDSVWHAWQSPESIGAMMMIARRDADKAMPILQKIMVAGIPIAVTVVTSIVGAAWGTMYVMNNEIHKLAVEQSAISQEVKALSRMVESTSVDMSRRIDRNEKRIDEMHGMNGNNGKMKW